MAADHKVADHRGVVVRREAVQEGPDQAVRHTAEEDIVLGEAGPAIAAAGEEHNQRLEEEGAVERHTGQEEVDIPGSLGEVAAGHTEAGHMEAVGHTVQEEGLQEHQEEVADTVPAEAVDIGPGEELQGRREGAADNSRPEAGEAAARMAAENSYLEQKD